MINWMSYLLEANIYLLIIGLSYRLGFRKARNFNFGRPFLLLGTISSLVIPFLKFPEIGNQMNGLIANSNLLRTIQIDSNSAIPFDYSLMLATLLIIVGIYQLSKLFFNLIKVYKIFRKAHYRSGIYYLQGSMAAFSFLNFILIGDEIPNHKKEVIINHELVHVKKLHTIDILLLKIFQIVFWYNPIIYLISNSLKELHEYEADQLQESDLEEYLEILLQQNFEAYDLSFIHQFNSNHLKNRIMRIKDKTSKSVSKASIFITLIVFIVAIAFSQNIELRAQSYPIDLSGLSSLSELSKLNQLSIQTTSNEDKKAQFPGGQKAFVDYLLENIKYPEEAKKENISGTVYIEFTINKKGKCKNIKVLRGINKELDEAALKVLRTMPDWEAAEVEGKKVSSKQIVPIKYRLSKKY